MPSYVVKQPNGRLAVFSTVVDDFLMLDATPEEILEYFADKFGREQAEGKLKRGLEDWTDDSGTKGHGLSRYCEAIDTVRAIHGNATARKRKRVAEARAGGDPS